MNEVVNVIGAGLAGCECAYILSKNNIKCRIYEMKPNKKSPAHISNNFAELVCSNSLKSNLHTCDFFLLFASTSLPCWVPWFYIP